jgi:hypothetical protein
MNKLIIAAVLLGLGSAALADQPWQPQYYGYQPQPCVQPVQSYEPTCTYNGYQPCNSPDISDPVITRSEYPGALDPVRRLPAWVYNP